jgi:hypothetical protein
MTYKFTLTAHDLMAAGWPGQLCAGDKLTLGMLLFLRKRIDEGWEPEDKWAVVYLYTRFPK